MALLTPAEIKKELVRNDGNLRQTAHVLGVDRSWLYKLVADYGLWGVVNEARASKMRNDGSASLVAKARAALRS